MRHVATAGLAVLLAISSGCGLRTGDPDKVRISYWEKWTGDEGAAIQKAVDAFNTHRFRNSRGRVIVVERFTVSQIDRKLLLAVAGNNPPDVAGLWSWVIPPFADRNALMPLDERFRQGGMKEDDFVPAYLNLCRHRGRLWALPTTPGTVGLYWNKEHFKEAGLDPERPPRTIEELDEYAEKLTRRENGEIVRMGFTPTDPGWWNWAWGYYFGGRLWDGESQLTANCPENVRAFEWVQSYSKQYGAYEVDQFHGGLRSLFDSPQNAFLSGKLSMVIQGVWLNNFIKKYNPKLIWGAAPFPVPKDRPDLYGLSMVECDVVVIPRGSKHPEEAFRFIRYLNSIEGSEILCGAQGKHTPLKQMSPVFLKQHSHPYLKVFIDVGQEPTFASPKLGIWSEYVREMGATFESVWFQRGPAKAALDRVQARIGRKWRREIEWLKRRGLWRE